MPVKKMPQGWICSECKQPIPPNDGHVQIFNANPELGNVGGYPIEASGDPVVERTAIDGTTEIDLPMPNIGMRVVHGSCMDEDAGGYWILAPNRLDAWHGWALHLTEKTWMGYWDFVRMITFWYHGHGLPVPGLDS